MPETHLRAGDTEREAVAEALGTHMAAGRLTLAEYDERLAQAYAARTVGELAELTADLPSLAPTAASPVEASTIGAPSPRPVPTWCGPIHGRQGPAPVGPWAGHGQASEHAWRAWLTTSVTVLAIYLAVSLASSEFSYFWPMWVIGHWGAVLLAQRVSGAGSGSAGRRQVDR